MALDIDTPVFKYFKKDEPNWVKMGKYMNWLFTNHVPGAPGASGTFALKLCSGLKKPLISADFWCAPIGKGYCFSIIETDELKAWLGSVKYLEELRQKAIAFKAKQTSKPKRKR